MGTALKFVVGAIIGLVAVVLLGVPLLIVLGVAGAAVGIVIGVIGLLFGLVAGLAKLALFVALPVLFVAWLVRRGPRCSPRVRTH
jgi:hypothetical protein